MRSLLPVLLLVLALAGCRASLDAPEENDPETLIGPTWSLIFFAWSDGTVVPVSGASNYTVEFRADRTVAGRADCNTYSGVFTAEPTGHLLIEDLDATSQACNAGSAGGTYLSALRRAGRFEVAEGSLHVYFEGQGALTFARR